MKQTLHAIEFSIQNYHPANTLADLKGEGFTGLQPPPPLQISKIKEDKKKKQKKKKKIHLKRKKRKRCA